LIEAGVVIGADWCTDAATGRLSNVAIVIILGGPEGGGGIHNSG